MDEAKDMTAPAPKMSDQEKHVLRAVGRAIWRTELPAKATVEQKKSSWSDGRRQYMSQAKKLVRALGKEKVTLTAPESEADASETSEA